MTLTDIMPWWVGWLGPVVFVAMIGLWVLLVPTSVLWRLRRKLRAELHWTERATLATQARGAIAIGIVLWPLAAIALGRLWIGPYTRVSAGALTAATIAGVLVGSLWVSWRFVGRDLRQPLPRFGAYVWLVARKWWPAAGFIGVGFIAPSRLTSPWMIPWTAVAIGALYGLRYLSELFVATGVAAPAGDAVVAAVGRAAARSQSEVPRTFVLQSHAANAAALPARNLIIMTQRLVDELDDAEVEAVALHEIAHLNEKRSVTRHRALANLMFLPLLGIRPLIGSGIGYLAAAVAVVAVVRIRIAKMGAREEGRADHEAVELAHESHVFGDALLKMHHAALIPAYVKRDPHGPLHDRLVRAGVTPDFEPITSVPKSWSLTLRIAAAMALLVAVAFTPLFLLDVWDGEQGSHAAIAFGWRTDEVLGYTGYLAVDAGDYDTGVAYLAEAVARGDQHSLVNLAWALGASDRCEEARQVHFDMLNGGMDGIDSDSAGRWVAYCYGQRSS